MDLDIYHHILQKIVHHYKSIIKINIENYTDLSKKLILPFIPYNIVTYICHLSSNIFETEPTILQIAPPVTIIGDLHGHIMDLLRIFQINGFPPAKTYLFLGDFIDRGEFSLETVLLLLILKILYPEQVYLIRGNHEFDSVCRVNGFSSQVSSVYSNSIVYQSIVCTFSLFPIAALISKKIFCVHAGFGQLCSTLSQINSIQRPIFQFETQAIIDLLWSDPSTSNPQFSPSPRGFHSFGISVFEQFLKTNKLSCMIRAHQVLPEGFSPQFNDRLFTVFSASNYCGERGNKSAFLTISKELKLNPTISKPLKYLLRDSVDFVEFSDKSHRSLSLSQTNMLNKKRKTPAKKRDRNTVIFHHASHHTIKTLDLDAPLSNLATKK